MDTRRFDRVPKLVTQSPLSRRAVLARSGAGLAALLAVGAPRRAPAFQDATPGASPAVHATSTPLATPVDPGAARASRIYVNSPASDPESITTTEASLAIVDAATLTVTTTVALAAKPHHFYKVPDRNKAYISHFGGTSFVEVVDLLTDEVVGRIPTGNGPRHLGFSHNGRSAFTADYDANSVTCIDTESDQARWSAPAGAKTNYVVASRDDALVFAANFGGSSVTVLEAESGKPVADVAVGQFPFNLTLTRDGEQVLVANAGSNDVSFVDVAGLQETARVSILGSLSADRLDPKVTQRLNLHLTPDGQHLWLGNQAAGVFAVLDVAARELVAEVPTGETGGGADNIFWPGGGPAAGLGLATNRYSPFVSVVRLAPPFEVVETIPTGLGTHYVSFDEAWATAYASSRLAGTFSVIDLATLTETARVPGFPQLDQAVYVWFEGGQAHSYSDDDIVT